MKYQGLKTPFFALASLVGTCLIIGFNPRLDWVTLFWLSLLAAVLAVIHIYWEKKEDDQLREFAQHISALLHSPGEQHSEIPLPECLGAVLDEIQKTHISLNNLREEALWAKEQMKRNMEDVTHQIKTPLTGIMLFLDLLESDPEHGEEYRQRIRQEVEHLLNLSSLLLKLSSLDAGSVLLKKEPFSAKGLLLDVEFSLDPLLRKQEVSLEVEGEDYTLVGDRVWLMEALLNIVKNAVEVSPRGERVSILLHQNAIYQSITVQDRGPGLNAEQQKRIFERFYRCDPRSPGFGIGLPLAQTIVRQHNGEVLVRSLPQGSEFEVRFYRV